MALKGHTRIELTNVETGEVEVHEDNNMVTNALSKLLEPCGIFAKDPMLDAMIGQNDDSLISRLTAGLMLFDQNIEENPNIINAPAGVRVVGCGSKEGYSGANTMAGSYNLTESGFTENGGFKHVWDFSTAQANGNIACASLTTNAGGKITEGTYPFSNDYYYKEGYNFQDETTFFDTPGYNEEHNKHFNYEWTDGIEPGQYPTWVLFADGINNRIIIPTTGEEIKSYQHNGVDSEEYERFKKSIFYKKSIDLSLYRIGFSNVSIFDYPFKSEKIRKIDTVTIPMPQALQDIFSQDVLDSANNCFMVSTVSDDDNIYILLRHGDNFGLNYDYNVLNWGDVVYVWKINALTFESSYFVFQNKTGEPLLYSSGGNINQNMTSASLAICENYVFAVGRNTNNHYLISTNNSDDITLPTFPNGSTLSTQNPEFTYVCNNKIYTIGYWNTPDVNGNYSHGKVLVIDLVTLEMRWKNWYFYVPRYDSAKILKVKGSHYFISAADASYVPRFLAAIIDPTFLITINNLENPVTKTSAQTMKVTYVLSPA